MGILNINYHHCYPKAIMENLDINEHQAELAKILYDYRDRLKNKDIIKEEEKEEDLFDY